MRLEAAGQELAGKKAEMFTDWKLLGFGMEVVNGGSFVATKNETKGAILDLLQAHNRRIRVIWIHNWCCIVE